MVIHNDKYNFQSLLEIVAESLNMDVRIIEKDYWIVYALKRLSQYSYDDLIIFRGGTSLTKCYKDLKRFSEDIDLAININEDLSKSKIKKIMTDCEKYMCESFKEINSKEDKKTGSYRNVEYQYPTIFNSDGNLIELNPRLKIETVTFLHPNPFEKKEVNTFLYDYLKENDFDEVIEKYDLRPFEINVLSIKRTLIDKIVSLVRMSYEKDLNELTTKTRHLYDLHLTYADMKEFYYDKKELTKIIDIVRKDEKNSLFKDKYPYLNKWSEAPLFKVIDSELIKNSYENKFGKEFVYGELPSFSDVLKSLFSIKEHLRNNKE